MARFISIIISLLLFLILKPLSLFSQCGIGQTPISALPVCNGDTISQGTVAACTPKAVPYVAQYLCISYNSADYYTGKPMWYKFHCFTSGTFGFYLKYNINDTYEWQLYDITGFNPNDVFTNDTLAILGSWYVNTLGYKGTAPNQNLIFGCSLGVTFGNALPYNIRLDIQANHDYLLLINHRTSTPDYGYKFTISGGTAVITDVAPTLQSVNGKCGTASIGIKLSKKVENSSIAIDGSDFTINSSALSITGATAYGSGNITDSVILTLNNVLTAGTYKITVQKGTDNNTLHDYCFNSLAIGASVSFSIGNAVASFNGPSFFCPDDVITFTNTSSGNILSWYWDFGNAVTSSLENPLPQVYPSTPVNTTVPVSLTIKDEDNCIHRMERGLTIVNNCLIAVPSAFTPNHDGNNDYLYPLNAWKARDLKFRVYNKFGQLVFFTNNWLNKWDGTFKSLQESPGTYLWTLSYIDENNQKRFIKGTSILIR